MAASPYRSTCTIDGTKFDCLSIQVSFATDKDRAGMPQMGSLHSNINAFIDFHDDLNLPYSTLSQLFALANVVTRDKVKPIKLEFWKDDTHADALCTYSFNGWIGGYHMMNPSQSDTVSQGGDTGINHVLVLNLEPSLNTANFPDIALSN